ncbi:hypothetical protein [Kitasatospora sp. NPDC088351]|uniref:hypothetical protein n=1 Tax=Kitasatospora sp. NPDC088351 TaxID=3155180 RepID=UPI00344AD8CE
MTTLDQTATDPTSSGLPAPDVLPRGLPEREPADGERSSAVPAAGRCSIVSAADPGAAAGTGATGAAGASGGALGAGRDGSVPRPRGGAGAGAGHGAGGSGAGGTGTGGSGAGGEGDQTAARLRAGLAERLRSAYAQGRSLSELAAACRRPVAEVHALLAEGGAALGAGDRDEGFVRLQRPAEPASERAVPVLRAAQEELRTALSRRPAPSRRLRRMHPRAEAAMTEAAHGKAVAAEAVPAAADPPGGGAARVADAGPGVETPLGILIGGTPNLPEAVGRPEERQPVRVTADLIRIGPGTCLVVLPDWRPAIAVSVPTEQLLTTTGLGYDELADARLSVLISPGALHDRELDLHDWRAGSGPGRRGGR